MSEVEKAWIVKSVQNEEPCQFLTQTFLEKHRIKQYLFKSKLE